MPTEPLLRRVATGRAADRAVAAAYGLGAWAVLTDKIHPTWAGVLATAAAAVSLAVARDAPAVAFALALGVSWAGAWSPDAAFVALPPLAWALARIAAGARLRPALGALALAMTGPLATALPDFAHTGAVLPFAFVLAVAWIVGYAVGQDRRYTAQLLLRERDRARRGVVEERMRIARELHDVVAHSLSVVTVQAAHGRLALADRPAEAEAALAHIETAGRETLAELRRLLGVLRDEDADAALAPAPGLADLDRLVAAAGVRVALTVDGARADLPAGVELCAYRVVQEALTNVTRHAGADTATVRIGYAPDALAVEIVDAGRGGPVAPGGHGLAGIRERVALYGGTTEAGPLSTGGFAVRVRLPLAGR